MKNALAVLKKHLLALSAGLALVAVLGVGYFDTYPTYIKTSVQLSAEECTQVATLVAVQGFKKQYPDKPIPKEAVKEMESATRLAKRVANYIIEKNPEVLDMNVGFVYQQLTMACLSGDGKAELK